jgi:hypothetical protein
MACALLRMKGKGGKDLNKTSKGCKKNKFEIRLACHDERRSECGGA